MEKINVENGQIDGLLVFTPKIFSDDRGTFSESFNRVGLGILGFEHDFPQDNVSRSTKNVIRGLHYQWDLPMGKLVQAVKGSVLDVAVDIRQSSPTFGHYQSIVLSESNGKQFWVPPGFAHGFLSLEHDTIVYYKCTAVYNENAESGINPLDKTLDIDWGVDEEDMVISEKDQQAQSVEEYIRSPKFKYL